MQIPILEVIKDYLVLKPVSSDKLVGLCPFHRDKNPSFYVYTKTQSYHCFGCKESGDAFKFLMTYHSCSFREARDRLTSMGLIEGEDRVLDETLKLYHNNLKNASSLLERVLKITGYTEEEVLRHRLGWSDVGVNKILMSKFGAQKLSASGLINPKTGAFSLSQRLTIPLRDRHGSVLAFQGRTLMENSVNKYIMSYNHDGFVKSNYLFDTRPDSRDSMILVEGVKDAIKLDSLSYKAVALLGSAVSEEQLNYLSRANSKAIFLMFDNDLAGLKIRQNLIDSFRSRKDFQVLDRIRICSYPTKDPADLCLKGAEMLESSLYSSLSLKDYLGNLKPNFSRGLILMDRLSNFSSRLSSFLSQLSFSLPKNLANALRSLNLDFKSGANMPDLSDLRKVELVIIYFKIQDGRKNLSKKGWLESLNRSNIILDSLERYLIGRAIF